MSSLDLTERSGRRSPSAIFLHFVLNEFHLSLPLFLKSISVKWVLKSPFYRQGNGKVNDLGD